MTLRVRRGRFLFAVTASAVPLPPQGVFTLMLGPFAFFSAQKTKYLQILTSLMRWMGKNNLCFLSNV